MQNFHRWSCNSSVICSSNYYCSPPITNRSLDFEHNTFTESNRMYAVWEKDVGDAFQKTGEPAKALNVTDWNQSLKQNITVVFENGTSETCEAPPTMENYGKVLEATKMQKKWWWIFSPEWLSLNNQTVLGIKKRGEKFPGDVLRRGGKFVVRWNPWYIGESLGGILGLGECILGSGECATTHEEKHREHKLFHQKKKKERWLFA